MMISFHILLISLVFAWIYFLWSRRRYYAFMLKVPGPKGYPLIGIALDGFSKKVQLRQMDKYFKRYGNTFLMWMGHLPFYIVNEPQLIQDVLNSQDCIDKTEYLMDIVSDLIGDGIITAKNPKWSKHRKLLNPGFKHSVLLSFFPIFNNETNNFLKLMDTYVGTGERNLLLDLAQFTFRIAQKTTMGNDAKEEPNAKGHTLAHSTSSLLTIFGDLLFAPWLRNEFIRKLVGLHGSYNEAKSNIKRILTKMIDYKLETENTSKLTNLQKPEVFIDHALIQLKNGNFTYQNVLDETLNTVIGAFETTADAIFFTLTLLAMYPEYQEKLYVELREVYPNAGDFEVTNDDLQKLDYLDRILNESMRIISPVPMASRHATSDIKLSNGVLIPKGMNIIISIFHLHRSEGIWGPEAKTFNPDNFLPDNIREKHPYSFIPFLKGLRTCIGWRYGLMSVKIALIKLLRNYKFSTKFRYDDLDFAIGISMKLLDVPLLSLEKRRD